MHKFKNFLKECDLTLSIIFSLLPILFVLDPSLNENPVRIVLGLLSVLLLPGYSLVRLLFPRKNDLSGIERTALSFVLSLAIVPLLGLVLNFTPFGIRLAPVLIILPTFTISLSIVAWIRLMKLPAKERFRIPFERLFKINLGQSVLDKGLSLVLIASIIGSSATLVYVVVKPKIGERFTEFYLLGPNGTASDYPTDLKVGECGKVMIGIVNHEYENITYRLEVKFNGTLINEEKVLLIENEIWKSPITFKPTKKGEKQKLEFTLYNNTEKEAYRRLYLLADIN